MEIFQRYGVRMLLVVIVLYQRAEGNICEHCSFYCDYSDYRVKAPCINCKWQKLTKVPVLSPNLTKTIKTLSLSNNLITNLGGGVFSSYSNLETLHLSDNKISNISEDAFIGLSKLTALSLYQNQIQVLPPGVFKHLGKLTMLNLFGNAISNISENMFYGLKRLENLVLTQNRIETLPSNPFIGLSHLKYLQLGQNQIHTLHPHSFRHLASLKDLRLFNNNITYISKDTFNNLRKLEVLAIHNNYIEKLYDFSFIGLVSIKRLYLAYNRISKIEKESFLPMRRLIQITLRGNYLTQVPDGLWKVWLPQLELYIRFNPFRCSCRLVNEMRLLQSRFRKVHHNHRCFVLESICVSENNFALGAKRVLSCSGNDKSSVINNNLTIHGKCPLSTCWRYQRIEFTEVIVVANLIVNMTGQQLYDRNYTIGITFSVKRDNMNNSVHCGTFLLRPDVFFFNISCAGEPTGNELLIEIKPNHRHLVPEEQCSVYLSNIVAIGPDEVVVKGYQKDRYNFWGPWNPSGPCSKPCGYGTRLRNRTCTAPTNVKCLIPGSRYHRATVDYHRESCIIKPCSLAVYYWSFGSIGTILILIIFGIVFWYRKYKMITYFDGLRPNPNFELDPYRTLMEQIEELPYDLHWEFPRYDVRFGAVLGEGNFGKVWHARAKGIRAFNPRDRSDLSSRAKLAKLQDQRVHDLFTTLTEAWVLGDCDTTRHYDVAVKTLKECATPKHKKDLASELKLLIYMDRHPNIVNVLAACTIRGDLWIIMEFCDHGCLKTFLSDRRNTFSPCWSRDSVSVADSICLFDLLRMCEQIMKGLMFIHCWKVIHRDLSARNILVDLNFEVKIADFGLARTDGFVASADDIMPIKWSSLESLLRHEYSTKSDIWSAGVLFWEIFSLGEIPYPGLTSREVIQQLKRGYRMDRPNHCPDEIWRMITECWMEDPELRPSATELFEQLDDLKVAVCAAPDGQYYGIGGEYGQAGSLQGPTLDEILDKSEDLGGPNNESGPSNVSYQEYCQVLIERDKLREKFNQVLHYIGSSDKDDETRLETVEIILRNEVGGHPELSNDTICNQVGNMVIDIAIENFDESNEKKCDQVGNIDTQVAMEHFNENNDAKCDQARNNDTHFETEKFRTIREEEIDKSAEQYCLAQNDAIDNEQPVL